MSRSGYSDDIENWSLIRYRGAVASAIRGARGQALFREIASALDAMQAKELYANEFQAESGFCTLGVVGAARGLPIADIDPDDTEAIAKMFGIAESLAREIMFENDDDFAFSWRKETPAERWARMRAWIAKQIKEPAP